MLKILPLFLLFTSTTIVLCERCTKYDFENDFESLFSKNSTTCALFSTWQIENYSNVIRRPNHESTKFISPIKVKLENDWQILSNCIRSFEFTMAAGGTVEVIFFIEAVSQRDLLYVSASKIVSGGSDVNVGFARYSMTNSDFKNGWNILKLEIGGNDEQFDGYVYFYGTVTDDATILVDSFQYIGPNAEDEYCELNLDTEIWTEDDLSTTADSEIVVEGHCTVFDLETDFDVLFNNKTETCSGSFLWEIGSYENIDIISPHVNSKSFIMPAYVLTAATWQTFSSCISSIKFSMEKDGSVEIKFYMEAKSLIDILHVEVKQIALDGRHEVIGTATYSILHPDYTAGWKVLNINVHGTSEQFDGYVSLLGVLAEGSVLLIDSFQYIGSTMDEGNCVIYTDEEITTDNPTTFNPTTENPSTVAYTTVNPTTATTLTVTTKTTNVPEQTPSTISEPEITTIIITNEPESLTQPTTNEPEVTIVTTAKESETTTIKQEVTTVTITSNPEISTDSTTYETEGITPTAVEPNLTTIIITNEPDSITILSTNEPETTTIKQEITTLITTYKPEITTEPITYEPEVTKSTIINAPEVTTIVTTNEPELSTQLTTNESEETWPITTKEPEITTEINTNRPAITAATDPTSGNPTTDFITTVVTNLPSEDGNCITYSFENDFDNKFNNDSSFCRGFPSWELDSYANINIERPHIQSQYFIAPTTVLSDNVWQTISSCVFSYTFMMEADGVIEVKFYMEAKAKSDNLLVAVKQPAPNGFDGIINLASYSSLDPNYKDGWNTLKIKIINIVDKFEGYVLFLGTISADAILIVDSFRYIGPTVDEDSCVVYTEVTTTSIPTTITTNKPEITIATTTNESEISTVSTTFESKETTQNSEPEPTTLTTTDAPGATILTTTNKPEISTTISTNEPEVTTVHITTDNPITAPNVEEDICITYAFEDGFQSLFTQDNPLCVGFTSWHLGKYSSIGINGVDTSSDLFITPNNDLSCIVSFPFPMSPGGIIEVNVFLELISNANYITVLAKIIVPNSTDTVAGMDMLHPSNPAFVRGWNVLRFSIGSMTDFNGYLAFLGAASDKATILVDSFRYIPPNVSSDHESCIIY